MRKLVLRVISLLPATAFASWTEQEKFLLSARTTKAAMDQGYFLPEIVEVHWGLTRAGKKAVVLIRKKESNPNCPNGEWRTEGFWAIFEADSQVGATGSGAVECDPDFFLHVQK